MRILLAIALVVLFGGVAVAASTPRGSLATATPRPHYTPAPAVEPEPPEPVERTARLNAHLFGKFVVPIEGAGVPDDPDLMPGASRDYRAGVHEGIDFPAEAGTPVRASASGIVLRVDTSYREWTREEEDIGLFEALKLAYTPPTTLDHVRGRQVWIDHGKGVVTRYAHLADVASLSVGQKIEAGAAIGTVGSSGYPRGGPHLHLEVRVGDGYFGDGLSGSALVLAVSRLFR